MQQNHFKHVSDSLQKTCNNEEKIIKHYMKMKQCSLDLKMVDISSVSPVLVLKGVTLPQWSSIQLCDFPASIH